MATTILIIHVTACILLTAVVLLQFGKGAEAGAMMGGGSSQAVFTSSAKGNFFTRATTLLAIVFMATSITLTLMKTESAQKSLFDDEAPVAAPLNSDAPLNALENQDPAPKDIKESEADAKRAPMDKPTPKK